MGRDLCIVRCNAFHAVGRKGWTYELVSDLGSGMNYHKKGLVRLLNELVAGDVERLVITHKDRLLRFGAELVFSIWEI